MNLHDAKRLIKRLLFGRPGPRKIKFGLFSGLTYFIDPSGQTQAMFGIWEREIVLFVRHFLKNVSSAADVGAASGWYTCLFLRCSRISRVYAFEPSSTALTVFWENLRLNGFSHDPRLTVVTKFVGEHDDDYFIRLDSIRDSVSSPLLLKVDVDGGELAVLKGSRRILTELDCRLVLETHSKSLENECRDLLTDLGYYCRIVPNAWWRVFLPEYRPSEINRWLVAWKP